MVDEPHQLKECLDFALKRNWEEGRPFGGIPRKKSGSNSDRDNKALKVNLQDRKI
jgi:hypothetical protein